MTASKKSPQKPTDAARNNKQLSPPPPPPAKTQSALAVSALERPRSSSTASTSANMPSSTSKKSAALAELLTNLKNKPSSQPPDNPGNNNSNPSFPNSNENLLTPASGIDEVLNEADELLGAAAESQALGRLRNASTYLLLAHARLVGLGRRFDRSRIEQAVTTNDTSGSTSNEGEGATGIGGGEGGGGGNKHKKASSDSAIDPLIQLGDQSNMSLPLNSNTNDGDEASAGNNNSGGSSNNNEPMLFPQTLHYMPDGVAYVEHLARAAMELHHKRTGRGMQHDAMVEKQAALSKARQLEQEQIRLAARGLFATAKGFTGVSVPSGDSGSGGGGGGGGENSPSVPTTRKRKQAENHLDEAEKIAVAKRKGGRGKKPPTLVMHTVIGKNFDVHDLMKGGL